MLSALNRLRMLKITILTYFVIIIKLVLAGDNDDVTFPKTPDIQPGNVGSSSHGFAWQEGHSAMPPWSPNALDSSLWFSDGPRLGDVHSPSIEASGGFDSHAAVRSSRLRSNPFQAGLGRGKQVAASASSPVDERGSLLSDHVLHQLEAAARDYHFPFGVEGTDSRLKWAQNMRKALNNPYLEFVDIDTKKNDRSRLFMARNAYDLNDFHPMQSTVAPVDTTRGKFSPKPPFYLTRWLQKAKVVEAKDLDRGHHLNRIFVYLNSRANMNYINDRYFLRQMQYLPVDPEQLTWSMMNLMNAASRVKQIVLPPISPEGLPLIMMRHLPNTDLAVDIQKVTGPFDSSRHIISLWGPTLKEPTRTTAVLYGLGQLDFEEGAILLEHLEKIAASMPHDELKPVLKLAR